MLVNLSTSTIKTLSTIWVVRWVLLVLNLTASSLNFSSSKTWEAFLPPNSYLWPIPTVSRGKQEVVLALAVEISSSIRCQLRVFTRTTLRQISVL